MLYELAFTPDVFDADLVCNDIERQHELRELLRQLADVGLVANLDKDGWLRKVREVIDAWPDVKPRREIVACLDLLEKRRRLVRHPKRSGGSPVVDSQWFDLVRESHETNPFDWVVTGDRIGRGRLSKTETSVRISEVRASQKWQPRHSKTIAMCESEYRGILTPILRYAKRLELVDPYLSARDSQHSRIVWIAAELMGRRGSHPHPGEIWVNTTLEGEQTRDAKLALDRWESTIKRMKHESVIPHIFKVIIWRSDLGDEGMHDRFLLTNQCGVSVPRGFDCYPEGTKRKTVWGLLDHTDHVDTRVAWDPQGRPSHVIGQREIK
jgi:hypothetical protein